MYRLDKNLHSTVVFHYMNAKYWKNTSIAVSVLFILKLESIKTE